MKGRGVIFILLTLLFPSFITGQTVHIGDILCTDGSTVSVESFPTSGKTAMGVVFYVDNTDSRGWAVSLHNQSSSIKWSSSNNYGYDIPDLPNCSNARNAMHDLNGKQNTATIRNAGDSNNFPAAWAVDFNQGWYLPSGGQLRYLYSCFNEINASLQAVGGSPFPIDGTYYWWSSSEFSGFHAYDMNTGGSLGDYVKDNSNNYPQNGIAVRQICDFEIQNATHPTYHIGDLVTNDDGSQGIIFYLSHDQSEGWMVALNDDATAVSWGNGDVPGLDNQTCSSPYGLLLNETDGYANTETIRAYQSGQNTAANAVDFAHNWYLPTAGQLSKLFGALPFIEERLETYGTTLAQDEYWSSSEIDGSNAFTLSCAPSGNVRAGHFARHDKSSAYRVRAVRNLGAVLPPLPEPELPDNILETDCNQPLEGNPWNVNLLYSTQFNDIAGYAYIVVGDIDGNGVTDVVTAHYNGNNYRSTALDVFSGIDLSLQHRITLQDSIYVSNGAYALARYPLDNGTLQGAIFVHSYDKKIRSYTIDGTLLNVSDRATTCDGMVSLADFNGDGYPEVYAGNDIFDAATLKWLCSGPASGNKGLSYRGTGPNSVQQHRCYFAMSLANNVLGDSRQELICGNTIYGVNIVSRTNPNLNSVTINKTVAPPSGYSQDGHVSLADFDLDGEREVLVIRKDTDDHTFGSYYFYAYKPSNGQILFQKTVSCLCAGYPLVGNIDDDPHPEIVFLEEQAHNPYIYCWRYTQSGLTTIWQYLHDDTSGQTGLTLFDFNQDEIMEIVYRDREDLRIINGSGKSHITGNDTICPYNIYTRMMSAGTGCEYPVVADLNGDGSAEIITSGLLDQNQPGAIGPGNGGLHAFGSLGNWGPARPVWNQYMYHVTNVNEDLTIPTYCFNTATTFTAPDGTIRRPYNSFLQQAYYITPEGEPYNPGGFIEVNVDGTTCSVFTFNGITYDTEGHYEQFIENDEGCDTLFLIDVVMTDVYHKDIVKNICDESYTWNGTTYTTSGNYEQSFTSIDGCDSIVTLHLGLYEQFYTETDTTVCGSFSWNGQEYDSSGIYEYDFTTQAGCDSIVKLNLTVNPYPAAIPEIEGLTAVFVATDMILGQYFYSIDSVPFATHYEWILDGTNWPMDTTGTRCGLWITSAGIATLTVRAWNGCGYSEQSIIIHAGYYDVDEHTGIPIHLYPNPAKDKIVIEAEGIMCVKVYDLQGQCVLDKLAPKTPLIELSLPKLAPASYILEVQTIFGTARSRIIIEAQ